MRLKIITRPTGTIDGLSLDHFQVGGVYQLGTEVACVFLAEGWAEIVTEHDAAVFVRPPPPDIAKSELLVLVVEDEPEMTAVDDAATQAERLRAVGVIKKPFDPDDLLNAVSAAIGSRTPAPDLIRPARP